MKKVLIVLAVLIVAVGVATTVFVGKLDGIIAQTIETEGTAALGTAVKVAGVETKFADGTAVIKGLTIANPAGYQKANAVEISSFSASVNYENQSVNEIAINAPVINAEILGSLADVLKNGGVDNLKSNFKDIVDNMPASEEESEPESAGDDPVITIKRFAIQNAKVNLLADQLGDRTFPMDDLVMTNLTGTPDQLSEKITQKMTDHISGQVKTYATKELKNILGAQLKEKLNEKINEAIGDKLGDKLGGKLGDKLGGKGGLKDLKLKFGK